MDQFLRHLTLETARSFCYFPSLTHSFSQIQMCVGYTSMTGKW